MLDTTERKLFQGHRDFSRFIHELSLARKIRIGICEAFTAIIDEEISNTGLSGGRPAERPGSSEQSDSSEP